MNHTSAIKALSVHLEKLNIALKEEEQIMDEPEMLSDYEFARASAANIELEIASIQNSIKVLSEQ